MILGDYNDNFDNSQLFYPFIYKVNISIKYKNDKIRAISGFYLTLFM